ncbi:segregation protein A [Endozoicomonas montiporae]|uniref:Selenide, water dikinase n=2 Tax=Endozoicomonas montiporae TaxID=1027273 RepID=A0A081MZ42_9GAMM|nr:selenide, water dikinase SelD [Endozoicomonas montiporae]AMO54940.1 selenide water dikinase [Endozoicomonas montiporae CL-33]KEQ11465.1 segregation protein A [Endozoicomonas montiporae]
MSEPSIDLLTTVEYGGCSAKLSPTELAGILDKLNFPGHPDLLVDVSTHDDAGVYRINDETALIFTTDFFPPVCSDPKEFGEIAAANALSDVFAMGGNALMVLNLMMYSTKDLPVEGFAQILQGGQNKVSEAGALVVGGHTIEDHPPKFGLAVIGTVHPDKVVSNSAARPGDQLILTKPLGTGALIAGKREQLASHEAYQQALNQMKLLNKAAADIMVKHGTRCATDVTGFGLLGHGREIANGSEVTLSIDSDKLPLLDEAYELFDDGCIPGATFRNLHYVGHDVQFKTGMDYNLKMLTCDAQTSGGLLICAPAETAEAMLEELKATGLHDQAAVIGEVLPRKETALVVQ